MSGSLGEETVFSKRKESWRIPEQGNNRKKDKRIQQSKKKKQTNHCSKIECNGLQIYKITRKAFHWYRFLTKDNDKISYVVARKKLTRNILLSRKVDEYKKNNKDWSIYHYGDLEIILSGMTIVNIQRIERDKDFIFHKRKYEKLSKRLGI